MHSAVESEAAFDCPIEHRDGEFVGPWRLPRQMLADQEYGGHESIHDDAMASKLGFRAGPIEGPTHFSQFVPLLAEIWGEQWFETGTLSAHYRNMVVEGERVRAVVAEPEVGAQRTTIRAEKEDGTEVLIGSASIGTEDSSALATLEERMASLRPVQRLVILRDLEVGMRGAQRERVRMDADQHMGNLYPFSLEQKLEVITEPSPWYTQDGGAASPWQRAIIPLEMVSVLAEYSSHQAQFPVRGPAIGLFAGQQIRMLQGPLYVGEDYEIEREIVALSESRRTESYWVKSSIYRPASATQSQAGSWTEEIKAETRPEIKVAEMILNHATLKESYEPYAEELAALGGEHA